MSIKAKFQINEKNTCSFENVKPINSGKGHLYLHKKFFTISKGSNYPVTSLLPKMSDTSQATAQKKNGGKIFSCCSNCAH
jgi:hypothetical protein